MFKKLRKKIILLLISFILIGCDLINQPDDINQQQNIEVNDVTVSIIDGDFNNQLKLELSSETENAIIRYTIDGSNPTVSIGTIYTNPIIIDRSTNIKAIAYISNNDIISMSRIIEETISLTAGEPRIIPGGVTFSGTLLVSIITSTDGAYIRYTTDGTEPSDSVGMTYTGPFTITEDTDVRAIAIKTGYITSTTAIESFNYDDTIPQTGGIIWEGSLDYYPQNPEVNWAFYHSNEGKVYLYNGSTWDVLSQDGVDGISIDWRGSYDSHPYNPEENWAYYNSNDGASYIYDGTSWQILALNGTDGSVGGDGQNGLDGISIIWQGSFENEPLSPELNWGYYNTLEGISYIYDGSNWSIIAKDGGITTVVAPVMVPGGTTYSAPTAVTLFTTTSGAEIRYTLDGTDPTNESGILYTAPILLEYSSSIKAIAYKTGMVNSVISESIYTINRVENPTFSIVGGEFTSVQIVTVSTTTSGATLYYTTDGSEPSANNYEGFASDSFTVNVDRTMNLRVVAVKDNFISSDIVYEEYTIQNVVVPPVFSLSEDYYTSAQSLSITTDTDGAIIYYTTNGTTPSNVNYAGYGYSVTIDITTTQTVKAIAVKTNWTDSTITSHTYSITGQVEELIMTPPAGIYTPGTEVVIESPMNGETIYYTLDGTTPTPLNYDGTGFDSVTITLTEGAIINAIGIKDYWADSEVITSEYVISDSVADPVVDIVSGLYNSSQTVTITSSTSGANIYYTLDGTVPSAQNYAGTGIDSVSVPISITSTLRMIATKTDMPSSSVLDVEYTIDTIIPVITLEGNTELYISQNEVYTDAGATASDDLDGDITASIIVSGTINTAVIGTYVLSYNVTDTAGNSAAEVIRLIHVTSAGTMVLPTIEEDTTWTAVNSPYNITYNTTVSTGVTLTIEPGVIVRIDPGLALLIDGTIIAQGTDSNHITFTNRSQDNWKNIVISALSTGTTLDNSNNYLNGNKFDYVEILNGGNNASTVLEFSNQNAFISNSVIDNSTASAISIVGTQTESLVINNTRISNIAGTDVYGSDDGNRIIYAKNINKILITNSNFIQNNSGAISFKTCDYININNSNFNSTRLFFDTQSYYNSITCDINNNTFTNINNQNVSVIDTEHYYSGSTLQSCFVFNIISNTFINNSCNEIINIDDNKDGGSYHQINGNIFQDNYTISELIEVRGAFFMQNNAIEINSTNNNPIIRLNPISHSSYINFYSIFMNNKVTNNTGTSVIRNDSDSYNKIRICNNVLMNPDSDYELYNANGFQNSGIILNANYNYWGYTDAFDIIGRIYDYVDDSSLEKTDYTPYALSDVIGEMVCEPQFSLPSGTYTGTQAISISTFSPNAEVYYTTDGSTPSASNYAGFGTESLVVDVTTSTTFKAIAIHPDYNDSEIIQHDYVID